MPQNRLIDMTGQRFGKLVVTKRLENHICPSGQIKTIWLCKCDCGNTIDAYAEALRNGVTTHCGCSLKSIIDLTGQRFYRLVVLEKSSKKSKTNHLQYWKCKCDCGKICDVSSRGLRGGSTRSCGCYKLERIKEAGLKQRGKKRPNQFLGDGVASLNALYGKYKRRAKQRNLSFFLTFDKFKELTKENCYYCGIEPKQVHKQATCRYIFNGIDRKNSNIGYTEENSVPCCGTCNRGKMAIPKKDFLIWVKKVYEHLN